MPLGAIISCGEFIKKTSFIRYECHMVKIPCNHHVRRYKDPGLLTWNWRLKHMQTQPAENRAETPLVNTLNTSLEALRSSISGWQTSVNTAGNERSRWLFPRWTGEAGMLDHTVRARRQMEWNGTTGIPALRSWCCWVEVVKASVTRWPRLSRGPRWHATAF